MPAGIGLSIELAKASFFDRKRVKSKIDRTSEKSLRAIGALVRRVERNSIRVKEGPSTPGQPPHAHGRDSLFRSKIFFVYDSASKSVLIGPALINGSLKKPPSQTVPEVLEFGGTVEFFNTRFRQNNGKRVMIREAVFRRMAARPYAKPALEKTQDRYPKMWRDEWRGGVNG